MSASKVTITPVMDEKTIAEFQKTADEQLSSYERGVAFETVNLMSDGKEQFLVGIKKHRDPKDGKAFSLCAVIPFANDRMSGECLIAEASFRPAGKNNGYPYDIDWPDEVFFEVYKDKNRIVYLNEGEKNIDVTDDIQLRFWLEDYQHKEMEKCKRLLKSKDPDRKNAGKRQLAEFEIASKLAKRFFTPTAEQQEKYERFKDAELERRKRVEAFGRTRKLVEQKWKKEAEAAQKAAKRKEQEEAKKLKKTQKNDWKRFKQNFLGD